MWRDVRTWRAVGDPGEGVKDAEGRGGSGGWSRWVECSAEGGGRGGMGRWGAASEVTAMVSVSPLASGGWPPGPSVRRVAVICLWALPACKGPIHLPSCRGFSAFCAEQPCAPASSVLALSPPRYLEGYAAWPACQSLALAGASHLLSTQQPCPHSPGHLVNMLRSHTHPSQCSLLAGSFRWVHRPCRALFETPNQAIPQGPSWMWRWPLLLMGTVWPWLTPRGFP